MRRLPQETIDLRQLVAVALVAFVVGMTAVLIFISWLMWRFVEPDTPWYELLHMSINGLVLGVIGGLASAAGALTVVSWWQHRRSVRIP
jgi:hypothetical protein